jgi:hypothetical protein
MLPPSRRKALCGPVLPRRVQYSGAMAVRASLIVNPCVWFVQDVEYPSPSIFRLESF